MTLRRAFGDRQSLRTTDRVFRPFALREAQGDGGRGMDGLAVTGTIRFDRVVTNRGARPGNLLFLSTPSGRVSSLMARMMR